MLELREDFSEKLLANSCLNPTARQVRHLYENWRQGNFGERSGVGMEDKLQEKISEYAKNDITVSIVQEPFAVVILMPLMKWAHALEEAERIAFARRRLGLTRGTKKMPVGRLAKAKLHTAAATSGEAVCKRGRPHCLAENIRNNVPNAKK